MTNSKLFFGFSLIEMLVVIFVFSILGIVSTQILALSLRGAKKSESIGEVRANVEYAVSNMERLMRNATSITCTSPIKIEYKDEHKNDGSFECKTSGTDTYIASGSAAVRLTSDKVLISCSGNMFTCNYPSGAPPYVSIEVVGIDESQGTGAEGASVIVQTRLQLRTYGEY